MKDSKSRREIMQEGYSICFNAWAMDKDIQTHLALLIIISSLSSKTGSCFASNKYLAEVLSMSEVSISRKVNALIKAGYLEANYLRDGKKIIRRTITLTNLKKLQKPINNIDISLMEPINNIDNTPLNNIDKDNITKENKTKADLQNKLLGSIQVGSDQFKQMGFAGKFKVWYLQIFDLYEFDEEDDKHIKAIKGILYDTGTKLSIKKHGYRKKITPNQLWTMFVMVRKNIDDFYFEKGLDIPMLRNNFKKFVNVTKWEK